MISEIFVFNNFKPVALVCISFPSVFFSSVFILWLIIVRAQCWSLLPMWYSCWYSGLECTFRSFTLTRTHSDGWKCKLIISLILLTMWYDNNILKRAHEWDTMYARTHIEWWNSAANDRLSFSPHAWWDEDRE